MDAKTAVDRIGKGKHRDINARFKAMASHSVSEPELCNPAAGLEKGQVEKNVQNALPPMTGDARVHQSSRAEPVA